MAKKARSTKTPTDCPPPSNGPTSWSTEWSSSATASMWVDPEDAHLDEASATPPSQGLVDGVGEGVASFPSKSFTSYRYIISLKDDKVQIWLEDRKSKKQWDTGSLSRDDIVKSDAAIAHAKLPDYVQCFYNCLSAPRSDEASDFQRDLLDLPNDQLLLELSLKLRVFTSTWTTRYTFVLLPVELKPLDVLSAEMASSTYLDPGAFAS